VFLLFRFYFGVMLIKRVCLRNYKSHQVFWIMGLFHFNVLIKIIMFQADGATDIKAYPQLIILFTVLSPRLKLLQAVLRCILLICP
jgi:hypothetical protein